MRHHLSLVFALTLLLAMCTATAWADTEVFTIDTANSGLNTGSGGCCTGPYATVTIDRTSTTTAQVTIDALTNGGFVYLIGSGQGAAVNVNGTATSSGFSGSNSLSGFSFTAGDLSDGGSSGMDGFGTFSNSVSFFDGFSHTVTHLTWTLTATGGTTWATVADVLANNSDGYQVAYHGFSCAVTCTGSTGATSTGFAVNGGGGVIQSVPEPATISLLSALGLVAIVIRSKNRKPAQD
ncbi:MAG: hypothetical protein C5B51_15130 [Terriglobia bacterium]|nr:MAG: hypothetical protein C5B51_15130 [Terriglobia bacterium]